jgi:hypothetical protein
LDWVTDAACASQHLLDLRLAIIRSLPLPLPLPSTFDFPH